MNIWIGKIFPVSAVFVFAYVKLFKLNGTIATFSGRQGEGRRMSGTFLSSLVERNR